jgi:hypothetical protein
MIFFSKPCSDKISINADALGFRAVFCPIDQVGKSEVTIHTSLTEVVAQPKNCHLKVVVRLSCKV